MGLTREIITVIHLANKKGGLQTVTEKQLLQDKQTNYRSDPAKAERAGD
jgi:hypothetical protein